MNYDDIIDLPHYEPKYHPRMLPYKRAAQFKPFLPLRGYSELVREVEQQVREEMDPNMYVDLDEKEEPAY